ncbi:CAZyme family AA7 [Penicillium chermesinum]|uniref:CAZyme family AA7 n=1 Tax=Penicillium chermesinum TaxID=63820 RepID=A0A9W9TVZ3_9EURO|nr:CAZyme family AA7 [Penicillium chermesinum]KAJ5245811.1 CAZyme family AA7 [Penicillium chermesinum]KAJ6144111.1 CAZyme family AA7 [Penicillium chermesinum]
MQVTELSSSQIEALRSQLTSATVLVPGSEGYDASLIRWSDTGARPAGVVVQPIDPADIAAALLWAQRERVDVAVKGGGHSTAGTSSSDGGLVIDLSRMKHVTVDPAQKTITAQGGATWKEVDEAGAVHGLATVGGTVNHTGVGGLTLGGGYGWLSGLYGLTIDNLLSARVVLADGRLVTASATENPDLFWGLRGAGYNFGVVVDFTYQAYDQPDLVFCGVLGFTAGQLERVVEQLNATLATPDPRSGAMCVLALAPDGSGPMVVVICFYNGSREEGLQRFSHLLDLEPVLNTLDMTPYAVVNTLQNPQATYGARKSFKGIFYEPPIDLSFVRTVFTDFMAKIQNDEDLAQSAMILEFFDMRKVCEVPLSGTAMASRNFTQNGIIYLRWTDPSKDLEHRSWARQMQSKWKAQLDAHAQTLHASSHVPQYINYAEPGDSAVPNIYGENMSRLQEVKAKYDPGNIFHKMHPVPLARKEVD